MKVMYRRILKEPLTTFPPAASPVTISIHYCIFCFICFSQKKKNLFFLHLQLQKAAQDLLLRWLERDPAKRLCDATEIKQHQFFAVRFYLDYYSFYPLLNIIFILFSSL